jgi:hypothetical protein
MTPSTMRVLPIVCTVFLVVCCYLCPSEQAEADKYFSRVKRAGGGGGGGGGKIVLQASLTKMNHDNYYVI